MAARVAAWPKIARALEAELGPVEAVFTDAPLSATAANS